MQLRILWQAETWCDVKFCWSQWKLVELSIKGTSLSPYVHVSWQIPESFSMYSVRFLWLFFLFQTHSLSPMCLQFSFHSEFLLLLNSEYLISNYSSTIQLPLQVATVFFPFFCIFHTGFLSWEFLINAAFLQLSLASPFSFFLFHLLSILYFIH